MRLASDVLRGLRDGSLRITTLGANFALYCQPPRELHFENYYVPRYGWLNSHSFDEMRRKPFVSLWTPEDVARLEALLDAGASAVRAAAAMNRTIISVQTKARQIGRPFPHKRAVKRATLVKGMAARPGPN